MDICKAQLTEVNAMALSGGISWPALDSSVI
jgi:hypothetical protein